jgi:hypothetical protein
MRSLLIWFLFAQLGLTNQTSNGDNTGSLEARQKEPCKRDNRCEETPNEPTAPSNEHVPSHEKRRDGDSETKFYIVLVTDTFNDVQIKETQTWLEGIVQDESQMKAIEVYVNAGCEARRPAATINETSYEESVFIEAYRRRSSQEPEGFIGLRYP